MRLGAMCSASRRASTVRHDWCADRSGSQLAGSAVRGADNYTYTAAEGAQGLVAWLNDKTANSSFRAVHVALPAGHVPRGSATLLLPVGLNLVLVGQGMDGANATTLNLEKQNLDIGAMLGDSGRLEFRSMSIRNSGVIR